MERSLGMTERRRLISFSKSMLRSLSASSITSARSLRRWKPFVFCRWSTMRPGVATMMCGPFASAICCWIMSTPPTITSDRTSICRAQDTPSARDNFRGEKTWRARGENTTKFQSKKCQAACMPRCVHVRV